MNEEIQRFSILEGIRCRPAFYVTEDEFGTVPNQLLQAALCHPLAELQCGSAARVSISIDGLSAVIADDGPGWPVHPLPGGRRFAETLLAELYACRDLKEHAKLAQSLCRITLPIVVALSERFTCDIFRDGMHWRHSFLHGAEEAPFASVGSCDSSGTVLSFSLDARFCGESNFSPEALSGWLRTLPPEIPQGSITFQSL